MILLFQVADYLSAFHQYLETFLFFCGRPFRWDGQQHLKKPDPKEVHRLATIFWDQNYEIKPLMHALLTVLLFFGFPQLRHHD